MAEITRNDMLAIAEAIEASAPFQPVSATITSLDRAYEFQDRLAETLAARPRWGTVAGYKIAANAPMLMLQLGLDEPLWARVFARTIHQSGATVEVHQNADLRIEPEIAVVLANTPTADHGGAVTADDIIAATKQLLPAIELIDMRGATRETAPMPHVVAQNISNIGAVLGGPGLTPDAYSPETMARVMVNGTEVASAANAAPQDPFAATAWLANALIARGQHLQAGDVILCGTHTDMITVRAGDRIDITIDPLGAARIDLG